jgi:tripartite-type tricarboxylate transporter receptor subunit TctC
MMMNKMVLLKRLLIAATLMLAGIAYAQSYPTKQVKIIVPYPAGGTTDVLARLVAERVGAKLGQAVIVENRGGAGGNIGAEAIWRSAADGYSLLFASAGPLAINKSLYPKLGYDQDTFTPISLVATAPNVLITSSKLPVNNLAQLIAYAKMNPERINYASQGIGSTSHLTAEFFNMAAGVKMVHVPYRGSSPAITDVLAGQVEVMFVELSSVLQHIRSGSVKILGVASKQRNPLLPNIPAIAEVLPNFTSDTWFGLVAPPKMPPEISNKLSAAVADALLQPALVTALKDLGLESIGSTPAALTQFTNLESERWGKVIRTTGMTAE